MNEGKIHAFVLIINLRLYHIYLHISSRIHMFRNADGISFFEYSLHCATRRPPSGFYLRRVFG